MNVSEEFLPDPQPSGQVDLLALLDDMLRRHAELDRDEEQGALHWAIFERYYACKEAGLKKQADALLRKYRG